MSVRKPLKCCFIVLASLLVFDICQAEDDSSTGQKSSDKSQQPSGGAQDLQKATQNPVSSLISVPVQNNSNFGVGPFDRTQNVLNIQPVIPVKLNEKISLIIRWITPIVWQPAPGTANLESLGIEENTPTFLLAQGPENRWGIWIWRYESYIFPVSRQAREAHLGSWPRVRSAHCYESIPWTGKIQRGAFHCCTGSASALDNRGTGEQCMVRRWSFRSN